MYILATSVIAIDSIVNIILNFFKNHSPKKGFFKSLGLFDF
ncbi:MAG: hypothetical protein AVDCRST_MAG96-3352 [uncultured Segetibacter sp.]|uniref:Uncharacterized protein n=1 Tax=uncultured Segetibacter sp. TaxID=481133 RepID=A0A6J4TN21_9BACT|nr:MAG: hypothetical protein AVDCRST_MAG96-3352 [uncultured Segetibacter sp.]